MYFNFEKWQGCHNDFILLRMTKAQAVLALPSLQRKAAHLCSRKGLGIGADGILLLELENSQDVQPTRLVIINQDGSLAKHCGNGVRCAFLSIFLDFVKKRPSDELPSKFYLQVADTTEVLAHILAAKQPRSGLPYILVDMGVVGLEEESGWEKVFKQKTKELLHNLDIELSEFVTCNISNRHALFLSEQASAQKLTELAKVFAPLVEEFSVNLHLVKTSTESQESKRIASQVLKANISEFYQAWSWERGVGATLACGSGASSLAAYAFDSGFIPRDEWVAIEMPGGYLYAQQREEKGNICLLGSADLVFTGQFEL